MRIEENFARQEVLFNRRFNSTNTDEIQSTKENSFSNVLRQAIDGTNEKLLSSDAATNSFVKGDDISVDEVMIKNQEAALSLQFLTQTRDKLLEGYETLSKLQL